jgi:shikimate kinase
MPLNTIPRVFLVGPMGAGKTTVGRRLAQALRRDFFDSDQEIEQRAGASIPLIFEVEGEAGFRAREKTVIAELTQRPAIVLATGGGAILDPENRRCLVGRGFVVYLQASVNEQLCRTRYDHHRPLLQTADPRARLEALFAVRDPLYRDVADLTVASDGQSPRVIVQKIINQIQEDSVCFIRNP